MKVDPKIVLAYFEECRLPDCQTEYKFHPVRKWRFDYAFVFYSIAIEVQGGIWIGGAHSRGRFLVRDYEKLNEAQLLGWIVLQVQPKDLCTLDTVQMIKRAKELKEKTY